MEFALIVGLIFLVALLYSSVGHAGASGYLAVMSLFGLQQSVAKPTALMLNILVASIATWQFTRAGHGSWRLLWPFVVGSVPFAFFGGSVQLPEQSYKFVVAVVLVVASLRLIVPNQPNEGETKTCSRSLSLPTGAGIGLLSGLTGTGGGVFLTPVLLFFRWADTKIAAGVSAAFILANSLAGLAGQLTHRGGIPNVAWTWLVAAGIGGSIGSYWGSRKLSTVALRRLLGTALLVAAAKLMYEGFRRS